MASTALIYRNKVVNKMEKLALYACLLNLSLLVYFPCQAKKLDDFLVSRKQKNPSVNHSWVEEDALKMHSSVYVGPQEGLRQADKIVKLPGQPYGVNFAQYAGYVTVDPKAGRELFYYFVESPYNSSTKPLVLWLNGGPGCSSLGNGAFQELGPFRVNSDGKTLFGNKYAWNEVANVLFLESPAGVGFSYSNTTSDYDNSGDKSTAKDAYTFLINWLERFPEYKNRDFYITGESYAGHYVPQLAYTILVNHKLNYKSITLKGIAIGNALIDDVTASKGIVDFLWTHALISDQTHELIEKYCDLTSENISEICFNATMQAFIERGGIDPSNIYAPLCYDIPLKNGSTGSVYDFDPCSSYYVDAYLNRPEVQKALHAKPTNWSRCSGDTDAKIPVTSSRYAINTLKLPIQVAWYPWYSEEEVGGYVVEYKGVTFVTVRGAGHLVPSWQPARSLTMILSFLSGSLPPASPWKRL
ncbi:hypothetical protein RJT34_00247 [Clitoria ternatea]|uniref:Carboxypeptidase n=1 Tax=Clitoria ternatea TaxID=43366 RepID=A0AAN9KFS4_CLITE